MIIAMFWLRSSARFWCCSVSFWGLFVLCVLVVLVSCPCFLSSFLPCFLSSFLFLVGVSVLWFWGTYLITQVVSFNWTDYVPSSNTMGKDVSKVKSKKLYRVLDFITAMLFTFFIITMRALVRRRMHMVLGTNRGQQFLLQRFHKFIDGVRNQLFRKILMKLENCTWR